MPSSFKTHMKTVELEDETNMIERVIETCSVFRASAIFNIMASKLHISMRRCVDKFHPFPNIARG